ncbi:MAG: adenosylcobalamin-dependent ribonucleoside-diphosphate reductase [Deltaproteobacteria bacterium]|nr:adenosylcobalamin-dependent ribonucleoside-diphosphate reductase [Deltaproteobacteria bacterium]
MSLELTENALRILQARYLKKDQEDHVVESPEEMFQRVAHHVASAETIFNPQAKVDEIAGAFYQMMTSLEFLPNSPTLMNAGRELGQLAACFVLPVEDSLESIFEAVKDTALIHQSGGGTGFSFGYLRPKNAVVSTTSGVASGPVSFMRVFNMATEVIKQGGTRRGANMGILRVDHPDIMEFIAAKRDPRELTSFNLSVGITRAFIEAVERGGEVELIDPRTGRSVETVEARKILDLIVECAWENGEPGIVFLDHINKDNPTPHLGHIESTNPCGEQPLLPYEACNLGSINLVQMIKDGAEGPRVDWEKLGRAVRLAVRFLDNVIEINHYPLPQIEQVSLGNRKIGLGVMGFAHFLILMGISYDSEEGVQLGEEVMRFIQEQGHEASRELAELRGSFPNFTGSRYDQEGKPPLRNATVTTIAPTGTLSIIANCSSGIEPLFALSYTRRALEDMEFFEIDPLFVRLSKEMGFWRQEMMDAIQQTGFLSAEEKLPPHVRSLFVTAFEIPPSRHVQMQAAFQRYTDNAVSKTINFPPDASMADVREAFLLAYRMGCKGVTMYRSGTRMGQVLTCGLNQLC